MKATVSKSELVTLISKIQSVVSNKPAIPILANILVEAQNDQLILSATDLIVSMRAEVPAKVSEPGSIAIPARRFFHLVRELTAPGLEIQNSSTDVITVQAGSSHFKINGMPKSEFPTFPDLSEALTLSIPNNELKEMLSRSIFAAARDDSRQVLNGVLFQKIKNQGVFIGTDGKRLARLYTDFDQQIDQDGTYIIPLKAADEMIKVLDSSDDVAKLMLTSDKIALEVGSFILISKLLAGQYPDVSRVIPEKSSNTVSLHREELISLLRQVSLFTNDVSNSVRFTFDEGELRLSATNGDIGEGKVSMPVNYSGSKLEIAFNPNYFLDILRHSKDETVNFDVTDSYNPGLISDSTSAQFVIMPMRLEV